MFPHSEKAQMSSHQENSPQQTLTLSPLDVMWGFRTSLTSGASPHFPELRLRNEEIVLQQPGETLSALRLLDVQTVTLCTVTTGDFTSVLHTVGPLQENPVFNLVNLQMVFLLLSSHKTQAEEPVSTGVYDLV